MEKHFRAKFSTVIKTLFEAGNRRKDGEEFAHLSQVGYRCRTKGST